MTFCPSSNPKTLLLPAGLVLGLVSLGCPGRQHRDIEVFGSGDPRAAAANPILAASDISAGTRQVAYFDRRGEIEWSIEGGTFLGDTQHPTSPVVLFTASGDAKVFKLKVRVQPEKPARHAAGLLVAKAAGEAGPEAPTYSFQGNLHKADGHAPELESPAFFSALKEGCAARVVNPQDGYSYDWSIQHGFAAAPRRLGKGPNVVFNAGKGPVVFLSCTATHKATGATSFASIGCGVVPVPQAPAIKVVDPVVVGFRQHAFIGEVQPGEEYRWELDPAQGSFAGGAATATGPVVGYTVAQPGPFTLHCVAVNQAGDPSPRTSLAHAAAGPFTLEPPKVEIPAHIHVDTGPYVAKVLGVHPGLEYLWSIQGGALEADRGGEVRFHAGSAAVLSVVCTAKDPATGATSHAQAVAQLLREPRKPEPAAAQTVPVGKEQPAWIGGGGLPGETYEWSIDNGTIQPAAPDNRGAVATFKLARKGPFTIKAVAVNGAGKRSEAGSCAGNGVVAPRLRRPGPGGPDPDGHLGPGDQPGTERPGDPGDGPGEGQEPGAGPTHPFAPRGLRRDPGVRIAVTLDKTSNVLPNSGPYTAHVVEPHEDLRYTWSIDDGGALKAAFGPAVLFHTAGKSKVTLTCKAVDTQTGAEGEGTLTVDVQQALPRPKIQAEALVPRLTGRHTATVVDPVHGMDYVWDIAGGVLKEKKGQSVRYLAGAGNQLTLTCRVTDGAGNFVETTKDVALVDQGAGPGFEIDLPDLLTRKLDGAPLDPSVRLVDGFRPAEVLFAQDGTRYDWEVEGQAELEEPYLDTRQVRYRTTGAGQFTLICKASTPLPEGGQSEAKDTFLVKVVPPATPPVLDVPLIFLGDGPPKEVKVANPVAGLKYAWTVTGTLPYDELIQGFESWLIQPPAGEGGFAIGCKARNELGEESPETGHHGLVTVRPAPIPGVKVTSFTADTGPDLPIRFDIATKAPVFQNVTLNWTLDGIPEEIILKDSWLARETIFKPADAAFQASSWTVREVKRRRVFTLTPKVWDAALGEPRPNPSDPPVYVGRAGLSVLAGETQLTGRAYLEEPAARAVPWRHVGGLAYRDGKVTFSEGPDHTLRTAILDRGGDSRLTAVWPEAGVRGLPDPGVGRTDLGSLRQPEAVAYHQRLDHWLVAEPAWHCVKLVPAGGPHRAAGAISIFKGTPKRPGGAGDPDGLKSPSHLAVHQATGLVFIVDKGNRVVKLYDETGAHHYTFPADHLKGPNGIAVDQASGEVYVTCPFRNEILVIRPTGPIGPGCGWAMPVPFAGAFKANENKRRDEDPAMLPDPGDADGDQATARFRSPRDLAAGEAGEVLVQDQAGHGIRRITCGSVGGGGLAAEVATLGGVHQDKSAGAVFNVAGRAARFDGPLGVAVGPDGTVFVADSGNHVVKSVDPSGRSTLYAGKLGAPNGEVNRRGQREDDGPRATNSFITEPTMIGADRSGRVFVLEPKAKRVRLLPAAPEAPTSAVRTDENGTPVMLAVPPTTGWDPVRKEPSRSVMFVAYAVEGSANRVIEMAGFNAPEPVAGPMEALAMAVDHEFSLWVLTPSANPADPSAKGDPRQLVLRQFVRHADRQAWAPGLTRELNVKALGLGVPVITGMAFDSKGHLYLGDAGNGTVLRLSRTPGANALAVAAGQYPWIGPLAEESEPLVPLNSSAIGGIAVTPHDDVVFTCGNAVIQFTSPGAPGEPWSPPVARPGPVVTPFGQGRAPVRTAPSGPAGGPPRPDLASLDMELEGELNLVRSRAMRVARSGGDAAAVQAGIDAMREYLADGRIAAGSDRMAAGQNQANALAKLLEARAAVAAAQAPAALAAYLEAHKHMPAGALKDEANAYLYQEGKAAAAAAGRDAEASTALAEALHGLRDRAMRNEVNASLKVLEGRAAVAGGLAAEARAAYTVALPGLPAGPLRTEAETYLATH